MKDKKMTFTLDQQTADQIDKLARRLAMPKSRVVREAVREYASQAGRLSEPERARMLGVFDQVIARIPERPLAEVEQELAALRSARRYGGRASPEGQE